MQTIFRVQSPATINGRVKEECFVFDFAPDRTLKVLAETAKISAKAGKTTSEDREVMQEFLNFCPVISYDGTKMKPYNVPRMLEQLKKVQVERVVRNGFEDGSLYNDQLLKLSDVDLDDFKKLKGIIGQTRAMPKSNDIELNKQGFDNEMYDTAERAEKKKRKHQELTDDEKQALEERNRKKKQRQDAISILRGISIRMPLLIYGAQLNDESQEITIQNFTNLIDDLSWKEFMPLKVTKEVFAQFVRYYDEDIFHAAGLRIRALARSADKLTIEERIARITGIFANFRNPDKETVLTPWRVVNMHLGDCLGGYNFFDSDYATQLEEPRWVDHGEVTADVFKPDSRILEINSKSGLYPLYMAYSIYRVRLAEREKAQGELNAQQREQLWLQVVRENIFVVCKTPMAKAITRRTLVGFNDNAKVNTRYFEDLINQITNKSQQFVTHIRDGKGYWKANNDRNMKFNAIVGNPPYQVMDGGAGASAKPIYQEFVNIAKKITHRYYSMIMPARWYAGGKGLDNFRNSMLNDKSIVKLFDYPKSTDCFNNVEIAGGLCYLLSDSQYNGDCTITNITDFGNNELKRSLNEFNVLVRYNLAVKILRKVDSEKVNMMTTVVKSRNSFGLSSFNHGTNTKQYVNDIKVLSSNGFSYVSSSIIVDRDKILNQYKVVITYAMSGGNKPSATGNYQIISSLQILEPQVVCTETFLVLGAFSNKNEAQNMCNYVKTKLFRFLMLQTLTSIHITKDSFQFVPMQDFTDGSDIDWSASVPDIDRQLYRKYDLTDEEVSFIERMIKPME